MTDGQSTIPSATTAATTFAAELGGDVSCDLGGKTVGIMHETLAL